MDTVNGVSKPSRSVSSSTLLTHFLGKASNIKMEQIIRESQCRDFAQRRTKIVCTMGPSCWDVDTLVKLFDAGLDVCRLNFSHGDIESHTKTLMSIRKAMSMRPDKHVAILLDTKGPEIRTGFLKDHKSVELKSGQRLKIVTDYSFEGDCNTISCSYSKLTESVQINGTILMADGSISLTVIEREKDHIICRVNNDAQLGERKNMNLPNVHVDLPVIGEKDISDIVNFGIPNAVHFIAASFVQSARDVELIRSHLGEKGKHIRIISKIENIEGIRDFDNILRASDGIMVARGDMGMEIPPEKVFSAQKWMIAKCNIAGKPVITATQMLESMHTHARPTRAEVTDVANAVLDGTDCVMLSGETANGEFPVEAVSIMARICYEAEACIDHRQLFRSIQAAIPVPLSIEESVCSSAVITAENVCATIIIAITETGQTARLISKYRPEQLVVAASFSERVINQLLVHRNILPYLVASNETSDNIIHNVTMFCKKNKRLEDGDTVVAVHGISEKIPGGTNLLKVLQV